MSSRRASRGFGLLGIMAVTLTLVTATGAVGGSSPSPAPARSGAAADVASTTPAVDAGATTCGGSGSSNSLSAAPLSTSAGSAIYAVVWTGNETAAVSYTGGTFHGNLTLITTGQQANWQAWYYAQDLPASSALVLTVNTTGGPTEVGVSAVTLAPVQAGDSVLYDGSGPIGSESQSQGVATVTTTHPPEWVGMGYSDDDGGDDAYVGTGESVLTDCSVPSYEIYVGLVDRSQPVGFAGNVSVSVNVTNFDNTDASAFYETGTTTSSPAPSGCLGMAYDQKDGYNLCYGPYNSNGTQLLGETWGLQNGTWLNLTASAGSPPPIRYGFGMVYDARDGYVLLFGGENGGGSGAILYNDTWTFSQGHWKEIFPKTSPSLRADFGMAFDATDWKVVLFGGWCPESPGSYCFLGDTWQFVAGQWTQVQVSGGPSPRWSPAMAYDANSQVMKVLLFGGISDCNDNSPGGEVICTYHTDTWAFHNNTWTQVPTAVSPTASSGIIPIDMAFDKGNTWAMVLVAGDGNNDNDTTWEFVSGDWKEITTTTPPMPGMNGAPYAMDFDPSEEALVLPGSSMAPPSLCFQEFKNGQWTEMS